MSSVLSFTDITGEETAAAAGSPVFCFLCGFSTPADLKVFPASHLFSVGFLRLVASDHNSLFDFVTSLLSPRNENLHSTSSPS